VGPNLGDGHLGGRSLLWMNPLAESAAGAEIDSKSSIGAHG
jgi:hypothetical protein